MEFSIAVFANQEIQSPKLYPTNRLIFNKLAAHLNLGTIHLACIAVFAYSTYNSSNSIKLATAIFESGSPSPALARLVGAERTVGTMDEMVALGSKVVSNRARYEDRIAEDRKAGIHMLRSSCRDSGRSNLRGTAEAKGREQKRLALSVPLWLTSLDQPGELDWTVTENVSARGARILTKRRWRVDEAVLVSLPPKFSAYGRVAYCQSLPSGNYVLGIEIVESSEAWLKSLEGAA
jgi:hypothetical protein